MEILDESSTILKYINNILLNKNTTVFFNFTDLKYNIYYIK